jgi:hypothetical protein
MNENPTLTAPLPSRTPGSGAVITGQERYRYQVYIDYVSPEGQTRRIPFSLQSERRLTAEEAVNEALDLASQDMAPTPLSPPPPGYSPYGGGNPWTPIRGYLGSVSFE